ncbi:right-handed parallel beta-helix repeat-containing protein [Kitasatospora mediocidica]|uniref:right-handed parallel beta-helix repeat-containing protein n=1 Tax=Kitasatospora mediocidica TaxID=58352 RepID=UPI000564CFAB|nr:right-handed parallel beta-helix repeat-containing protein [Kitasatospora mediocidica]
MRLRHVAGLAAATTITLLGLPALPAAADAVTTLYVDNSSLTACSDAGTGTQAQPYCTISAAAKVVQPGQTVQVTESRFGYPEEVDLTRSGTPEQPITFTGSGTPGGYAGALISGGTTTGGAPLGHALRINGVHDVTFSGFDFGSAVPVTVVDSSRITIDNNWVAAQLPSPTPSPLPTSVAVSGHSDHVSITRNRMETVYGVAVSAGAQSTVISTNEIDSAIGVPVTADDAPGTAVTNNTMRYQCNGGVSLTGASTGSSVENNVIVGSLDNYCPAGASGNLISLSADSVAQSRVDYNIVHPAAGQTSYSWAGTGYSSVAALQSATGQGAHDLDEAVQFDSRVGTRVALLKDGSAAIDSADPQAPGILDTDLLGNKAADDPTVANGPGGSFRDRGAVEFLGLTSASLELQGPYLPTQGPAPLVVSMQASAVNRWNTSLTYAFDFGDGSAPVISTNPQVTHTYLTTGGYRPSVTVTDGVGGSLTASVASTPSPVRVTDPGSLAATVAVTPGAAPLGYHFAANATSPWIVNSYQWTFGDGTTGTGAGVDHTYQRAGGYTATLTASDEGGHTVTVQQDVQVALRPAGYVPVAPTRLLDTRTTATARLGAGSATLVALPVPASATAVVLNVTATGATDSTHIDVAPTDNSGTSTLNLLPGQTVANLATVAVSPGDYVWVRNNSGSVDVVVDLFGYYAPATADKFTTTAPTRLLDTRTGSGAALGPGAVTTVQVAGVNGVPVDATAAVLNLTATAPDSDGFLSAYADGTARPGTSNVNFSRGQTVPNQAIVPIGADGKVAVYNFAGHTQVIADLFGYYSPEGKGLFTPVAPIRLADTRTGAGTKLGPGAWLKVGAAVPGGVPANATAVVLNVTATEPDTASYLAVRADGTGTPGTSNLNLVPGVTVANHVFTGLDANGAYSVYNLAGHTHVITDLFGYFTDN